MKVRAKFKGKDGSVGYKTGSDYTLRFHSYSEGDRDGIQIQEIVSESHGGAITRLRNESHVKYSSLRKFLDNWEVI
jgi:hypothetical protein